MITKPLKPLIFSILVLSVLLIILQSLQTDLAFQRTLINQGEWWRLISGNLVHANYAHLWLNLAGLWLFGFLFIDSVTAKTFILSVIFISIIVGLGLFIFDHQLMNYYGFSGVLYGLFLIGAVQALLHHDKVTGFSLLILLCGKMFWDFNHGGNQFSQEIMGIPVAINAHLYGLIGAGLVSLILLIKNKTNQYTPPTF